MSNIISKSVKTVKNWWVFTLTGILLIAGAVYVLYAPAEGYVALALMFSIVITVNGLSSIYFSISNRKYLDGWGWYLTGGIFELIFGIALLYYPQMSQIVFPIYTGFWLLFRGFQTIAVSFDLKQYGVMDWGWIMLFGAMIATIGTFMVMFPLFGFFNVIYLASLGLFLHGVSSISFSLKLKKIKSLTLDKVTQFKKQVKKEFKNLKSEIVDAYDNASEEDKKKVDALFDAYEGKVVSE